MRGFLHLLLLFVLLALESPLLYQLRLSFYAPDFAVIVILYLGMSYSTAGGVMAAMAIGLLKDGFALGSPLGLYMHICVVLLLTTRVVAGHLDLRSVPLSMVAALAGSVFSSLLFLLLTMVFDKTFDNYGLVATMMGPQALVTAPFAPVVFLLMEKVDGMVARRRTGSIFFS